MSLFDKIKGMRGYLYKELHEDEDSEAYKGRKFFIKTKTDSISIPDIKDQSKINIKYPLLDPFAYAHVRWDALTHQLVYNIIEPRLSDEEKSIYEKVIQGLVELVDVELSKVKKLDAAVQYLEKQVSLILKTHGIKISNESYLRIMYFIYRNFVGLNELEPLMHDPYIEDIGGDGLDTPVYVVHKYFGSIKTNIIYDDNDKLRDFLVKLAERSGRYISYAEPLLDGTLPDGSRVHASLASDVTTRGPVFSIRKFRKKPFTPIDMIRTNTVSSEALAYLWLGIQNGANILITGGTATGKTSILNALTMFVPPEDKIITIEDTKELNLPHENWIPSVARAGFGTPGLSGEKYGEVTLFDLLKESFRQNPDYVIVGEVRGKEAYVMFQGMSSGHPSMSTMHAGDVDSVLRRLITPPINLSPSLLESLDVVLLMSHAKERSASARRVKQITEIDSVNPDTGKVDINRVYSWDPATDISKKMNDGKMLEKIAEKKGVTVKEMLDELQSRKKILEWMLNRGIHDFHDVAGIISTYYKDPKKINFMMTRSTMKSRTETKIENKVETPVEKTSSIAAAKIKKSLDEVDKEEIEKLKKNKYDWVPFKVIYEK